MIASSGVHAASIASTRQGCALPIEGFYVGKQVPISFGKVNIGALCSSKPQDQDAEARLPGRPRRNWRPARGSPSTSSRSPRVAQACREATMAAAAQVRAGLFPPRAACAGLLHCSPNGRIAMRRAPGALNLRVNQDRRARQQAVDEHRVAQKWPPGGQRVAGVDARPVQGNAAAFHLLQRWVGVGKPGPGKGDDFDQGMDGVRPYLQRRFPAERAIGNSHHQQQRRSRPR